MVWLLQAASDLVCLPVVVRSWILLVNLHKGLEGDGKGEQDNEGKAREEMGQGQGWIEATKGTMHADILTLVSVP